MKTIWLAAFIASSGLLVITLAKKNVLQWLSNFALQLTISLVLLYVVNYFGVHTHFHLPINAVTIAAVGILGLPGILLLTAMKLALV